MTTSLTSNTTTASCLHRRRRCREMYSGDLRSPGQQNRAMTRPWKRTSRHQQRHALLFSSTALPGEHAAHHAPTVSDIRNQDARLVDARHACLGRIRWRPQLREHASSAISTTTPIAVWNYRIANRRQVSRQREWAVLRERRRVPTHHKWTNASLRAKKLLICSRKHSLVVPGRARSTP